MKRKTRVVRTTAGDCRVRLDDPEPARKAAWIIARRLYGRRGVVGTYRLDSWSTNGSKTFQASVGYPSPSGGLYVRSVWIYI